jgi:hypothetical protein
MSLQNKTIQRYRLIFPEETLREISLRTGIQITRVFRILNGKQMKLNEFEAFENVIKFKIAEKSHCSQLNRLIEDASSNLTNEEIGKIADYIERKIQNKKFSRTYIKPLFEDVIIA